MYRRKGLFWYTPKKRFFDFSTAITSLFGYGNSTMNTRIKNSLKKNSECDYPGKSVIPNTFIESQLSLWKHYYPALNHYQFFLFSDLDVLTLPYLSDSYSLSIKNWEIEHDGLLYYLNKRSLSSRSDKEKEGPTLISDIKLLYGEDSLDGSQDRCLYLHSCFPEIPCFNNSLPLFTAIIVGGEHPFGIYGQKLVLLRKDIKIIPPVTARINYWHLSIYREGIKYYYDLIKRAGYGLKKNIMEKLLSQLRIWAETENRELQIVNPLPLSAQITLKKRQGMLSSLSPSEITVQKNRLFYKDITVIIEEGEEQVSFYLHLPIHFTPQHLKNKWKNLVALFKII